MFATLRMNILGDTCSKGLCEAKRERRKEKERKEEEKRKEEERRREEETKRDEEKRAAERAEKEREEAGCLRNKHVQLAPRAFMDFETVDPPPKKRQRTKRKDERGCPFHFKQPSAAWDPFAGCHEGLSNRG